MQADLIGSLQARVDLLMAEADELLAGGVSAPPPMLTPPSAQPDPHIIVPLPARVFFPVQVHTVPSLPPARLLKLYTVPQQCCISVHQGAWGPRPVLQVSEGQKIKLCMRCK